jgi:hypothetical protein
MGRDLRRLDDRAALRLKAHAKRGRRPSRASSRGIEGRVALPVQPKQTRNGEGGSRIRGRKLDGQARVGLPVREAQPRPSSSRAYCFEHAYDLYDQAREGEESSRVLMTAPPTRKRYKFRRSGSLAVCGCSPQRFAKRPARVRNRTTDRRKRRETGLERACAFSENGVSQDMVIDYGECSIRASSMISNH